MYSFVNDYSEGAHERLMDALVRTNREQKDGYGEDIYCEEARGYLCDLCKCPNAGIHFLVGGTQTNYTMIAAALKPWQGVLSGDAGHITIHESGAIESTGHKVLPIPSVDGKVNPSDVERAFIGHETDINHEHIVQPAMLYISNPTEFGAIYTLSELQTLREVCTRHGAYLYMDGARLGCALTVPDADVTLADLARLCDAFYVGGTKMGALCGEALIIPNPALDHDFRYIQKQKGARSAKSFVIGTQFAELFRDGLYFDLARHANTIARRLGEGFTRLGIELFSPVVTNQVFVVLPQPVIDALAPDFTCAWWQHHPADPVTGVPREVVRFCASWATPEEQVDALMKRLEKIINL